MSFDDIKNSALSGAKSAARSVVRNFLSNGLDSAIQPARPDFDKNLEARRRSNPARAYLWALELPDLANHPMPPSPSLSMDRAAAIWNSKYVGGFGNTGNIIVDLQLLATLAVDISYPMFDFETESRPLGASFTKKAGRKSISNLTITFEEQENGIVSSYIEQWKDLIYNSDRTINPPFFYKREIVLYRVNIAKREFQRIRFKRFFMSSVANISNSYGSNEMLNYSVTFSGDDVQIETFDPSLVRLEQEANDRFLLTNNIDYVPFYLGSLSNRERGASNISRWVNDIKNLSKAAKDIRGIAKGAVGIIKNQAISFGSGVIRDSLIRRF